MVGSIHYGSYMDDSWSRRLSRPGATSSESLGKRIELALAPDGLSF